MLQSLKSRAAARLKSLNHMQDFFVLSYVFFLSGVMVMRTLSFSLLFFSSFRMFERFFPL